MSKYVYVLRLDFYHEWAWENGSAELVMVSDNINTITSKLKSCLEQELFESDNRIVESPDISIDELIDGAIERLEQSKNVYVDIYTSDYNYDNGCNHGTYIIEKMEVK